MSTMHFRNAGRVKTGSLNRATLKNEKREDGYMEKNVGGIDRTARLVIGLVLLAAGVAGLLGYIPVLGAVGGAVAVVLGLVLVGTGVTQKCMINKLLGVDTLNSGSGE